jgi:hypothetical protein
VIALARVGCWLLFRHGRCKYIALLHPRLLVHAEEPHPMGGDPVYAEHSESKYINQITNKIIPYVWSSHTNITMWLFNFHKPYWKQNECNDNNLQCVSADQTSF